MHPMHHDRCFSAMPLERPDYLAALEVPQPQGSVKRGEHNPASIGRKCYGGDLNRFFCERT
jgi:hypothetical protein